jgi:hypothetical protein
MKLITELVEDVKYLVEEKEGKKNLYIEGIYLQGNIKNKNGRFYSTDILEKEVNRYNEQYVKNNRALGELGHPSGPSINLDRVSHKIESLRKEGNNFIGRAKILDTPMGSIAKNLIESGCSLGVSSRGMGSLKQNRDGINEVQDDFYLATAADIVADPSAPDAFVQGIMEGVEFWWDNGLIKASKIDQIKEEIKRTPSRQLEKTKIRVFESFVNQLSNKQIYK